MKAFQYMNTSTPFINCARLEDEICNGGPKLWTPLINEFLDCPKPCKITTSQVFNTRGGSNKRVDWNFSSNLISEQAPKTAGRMEKDFIFVGKKTGRLEIFLTIIKRVCSNNSGQDGKMPEN